MAVMAASIANDLPSARPSQPAPTKSLTQVAEGNGVHETTGADHGATFLSTSRNSSWTACSGESFAVSSRERLLHRFEVLGPPPEEALDHRAHHLLPERLAQALQLRQTLGDPPVVPLRADQGHPEPEGRAGAVGALEADRASHQLDDVLGDDQPQPGPSQLPGDGAVRLGEG